LSFVFAFRRVCALREGRYSEFVATWLAFFPRNQLLVLRQEDLISDPVESYANATTFLGLPPLPVSAILVRSRDGDGGAGEGERNGTSFAGAVKMKNAGNYDRGRKTMLPKTRSLLNDFYRPFNRRLAEMLGDERFAYGAL
jgi:N-acetylgalactosamine 4-sulfate 6-O-sulfotransferase